MNINTRYLKPESIADLEARCIDQQGYLQVVPASTYAKFSPNQLGLLCLKHGLYCLPTDELIGFLRSLVEGKPAIEIGAGNGCIGRALGIPATDSYLQATPETRSVYQQLGQPAVRYHPDVVKMDAVRAVAHYQPEVVIAAWVSHKWLPGMEHGNPDGVEEEKILQTARQYVVIGNDTVHGYKPILRKFHHIKLYPDWLFSRSSHPEKNVIYLFESRR